LDGIASRFSVSVSELQRWNHIRTEHAPRGRTIRIYENTYPGATAVRDATALRGTSRVHDGHTVAATVQKASQTTSHSQSAEHRVRPGETLWSIAHTYGTTVAALKQENPFLASRELRAGDRLSVATKQ
ncbi:MAG: LysM peptidoglycan-binding domain-containing protein, partial [Candidatus Binataceae bacterium]